MVGTGVAEGNVGQLEEFLCGGLDALEPPGLGEDELKVRSSQLEVVLCLRLRRAMELVSC